MVAGSAQAEVERVDRLAGRLRRPGSVQPRAIRPERQGNRHDEFQFIKAAADDLSMTVARPANKLDLGLMHGGHIFVLPGPGGGLWCCSLRAACKDFLWPPPVVQCVAGGWLLAQRGELQSGRLLDAARVLWSGRRRGANGWVLSSAITTQEWLGPVAGRNEEARKPAAVESEIGGSKVGGAGASSRANLRGSMPPDDENARCVRTTANDQRNGLRESIVKTWAFLHRRLSRSGSLVACRLPHQPAVNWAGGSQAATGLRASTPVPGGNYSANKLSAGGQN